jgi:DNA-binding CsgD family transcriptional regulator
VDAELLRLGAAGGQSSELSPTERMVAGHVVDGLTNQQVAERLFISVKTVEANLTHVYRKVGVRSRQELVRWCLSQEDQAP